MTDKPHDPTAWIGDDNPEGVQKEDGAKYAPRPPWYRRAWFTLWNWHASALDVVVWVLIFSTAFIWGWTFHAQFHTHEIIRIEQVTKPDPEACFKQAPLAGGVTRTERVKCP